MSTQQAPSCVAPPGEPFSAVNAQRRVITDYGPDPRNPAMQLVRDAITRLHGFLVPAVLGGDTDPELQFFGYGPQVQNFRGMATAGTVSIVYTDPTGGDIGSAVTAGPMGDPARRIFADRLARRAAL